MRAQNRKRVIMAASAQRLQRRVGRWGGGAQSSTGAASQTSRIYLVGGHPEEKEVLGPHPFADFHIGAVERADGQRAVQREFHVAGARGLLAGGRDLFGQVGGRDQPFGQRDVVVRQEHDLQLVARHRIGVNDPPHR
jgi:hypothetical protein